MDSSGGGVVLFAPAFRQDLAGKPFLAVLSPWTAVTFAQQSPKRRMPPGDATLAQDRPLDQVQGGAMNVSPMPA